MPVNTWGLARKMGLGYDNLSEQSASFDRSGALVVMDFYQKALFDNRGFQVRAGTITTPLVGDVAITDTAAEFCIDPASGMEVVPVQQIISIRLGTGTLHEYATKLVATASTAGTAFVPLSLNMGVTVTGVATTATTTARVQAAGAVTVTAELATTTRRHWSFSQAIAAGAYVADCLWEPKGLRVGSGNCLYTQIAATTTGPSYYANLDFLEFAQGQIGG